MAPRCCGKSLQRACGQLDGLLNRAIQVDSREGQLLACAIELPHARTRFRDVLDRAR